MRERHAYLARAQFPSQRPSLIHRHFVRTSQLFGRLWQSATVIRSSTFRMRLSACFATDMAASADGAVTEVLAHRSAGAVHASRAVLSHDVAHITAAV